MIGGVVAVANAPAPSTRFLLALASAAAVGNLPGTAIPGLSSGVAMLAAAVIAQGLWRMPPRPAGAMDWACFAAALLLAAMPSGGALAALALLGLAHLRNGTAGPGPLLLALGGLGLFALVGTGLLAAPVLELEARAVSTLLHLAGVEATQAGNLVTLPESRHTLMVLRGCSALALLPEVAVATIALARLVQPDGQVPWRALGLALGVSFALNLGRLLAMAVSIPIAETLHTDLGMAALQLVWVTVAFAAALTAPRQHR